MIASPEAFRLCYFTTKETRDTKAIPPLVFTTEDAEGH